jgi:enterochelin esterase-like enzyme
VTFAGDLRGARLPFRFFVLHGGHDWSLWRGNAARAYLAAARRLGT